jgi:hypothetical protein
MEVPARRVRGHEGREQVLVDLADFIALVDAATPAPIDEPLVCAIVERLRANLEADEPTVDVNDVLAAYDAGRDKR